MSPVFIATRKVHASSLQGRDQTEEQHTKDCHHQAEKQHPRIELKGECYGKIRPESESARNAMTPK